MSKTNSVIYLTVTWLLLCPMIFAQDLTAQNLAQNSSNSYSIAGVKKRIPVDENDKISLVESAKSNNKTVALKGMERAQVKSIRQQKQRKPLSTTFSTDSAQAGKTSHHSFSIYSGYSQLISDIDADGYYQTFSVSFDADILSSIGDQQSLVYADLYLSQNGGPWILYFSTDNFLIKGEDTEDEFEVVTQLDSGYISGHYDVLIDLYEVGYNDVVATYSANDSNSLYALPLESADYDPEYIEVEYYDEHGGSSGWILIVYLLILVYRRS